MPPLIDARRSELVTVCRLYGVKRLDLFGSAATGTFDKTVSDLDFLVSFTPEARQKAFDNYFGLRESLEEIFGCPVDLVTENSLKNPYLIRAIERERQLVYAA